MGMRRSDLLMALKAISETHPITMHTVEMSQEYVDARLDIMLASLPPPATAVNVKILKKRNITPSSIVMDYDFKRNKNGN